MIASSNISVTNKTYASLLKIILFLVLYINLVACGWWQAVTMNSDIQFFKIENGVGDWDHCLYANSDD